MRHLTHRQESECSQPVLHRHEDNVATGHQDRRVVPLLGAGPRSEAPAVDED